MKLRTRLFLAAFGIAGISLLLAAGWSPGRSKDSSSIGSPTSSLPKRSSSPT